MNIKLDKKLKKKNEILGASIELMYLKGYNGTSVKDITDAAGIPKGSFYNYFEDKEKYALDALDYYSTYLSAEKFKVIIDKSLAPLDRIKKFFELSIKSLEERGLKFGCFLGNMTQEMGDVNEHIAAKTKELHNNIVKIIQSNLDEAYENGDFTNETDREVLAGFIISSWQGTQLRMKVSGDNKVLKDFYTTLCETLLK